MEDARGVTWRICAGNATPTSSKLPFPEERHTPAGGLSWPTPTSRLLTLDQEILVLAQEGHLPRARAVLPAEGEWCRTLDIGRVELHVEYPVRLAQCPAHRIFIEAFVPELRVVRRQEAIGLV
jgi:hypothetical protein